VIADLAAFASLGQALDASLLRWADHPGLIEADRDRENERLAFREIRDRALRVQAWLEEGGFRPGDRAAIVLTNQSRWHLAAVAVLRAGGVLVPLDFKLSGSEHASLLRHCRARVVIAEHHLWRALSRAEDFGDVPAETVIVVGAPAGEPPASPPSGRAHRWEECEEGRSAPEAGATPEGGAAPERGATPAGSPPVAARTRTDDACIVYSSGTGGRPKGCRLTHGNYLAQLESLTALHPFRPGVRYLSILPTNHAIDFMVGFLGPYLCGATVVHLRTLRPELVREAFPRYRITHVALVPMVLRNLEAGLRARFEALPPHRRALLSAGRALHAWLGRGRPRPALARRLLAPVHQAFGGALEAIFVGGAYTVPETLRFFHGLGIPVANGYGLTEAGTAVTLDRLDPPRPDTVGRPLPGVELRIADPDADGHGEVQVRAATVMAGYLDDPGLTAETLADGWLRTGDLGRIDPDGCLRLVGRRKNMIVTEGGKNVYPEDVETVFEGLEAKERCVFAAHYLWPDAARDERLVLVVGTGGEAPDLDALRRQASERNRRLADYKRVAGILVHAPDFPRTASLKVKREELAAALRNEGLTPSDLVDLP
jgi:long-chain acyl-CoA synthetase